MVYPRNPYFVKKIGKFSECVNAVAPKYFSWRSLPMDHGLAELEQRPHATSGSDRPIFEKSTHCIHIAKLLHITANVA